MSRLSEQHVSVAEMNSIKGLAHYLNENLPAIEGLSVEVILTDCNGDRVGVIKTPEGEGTVGAGYSFHFLIEDPSDAPAA